jgi:hypothetical protein
MLNANFGYTIRAVLPLPTGYSLHGIDIPETAYCPSWTDVPNGASTAGYVLNIVHMENKTRYKKVFYMPYNANNLYYTTCNDGNWTGWTKVI